MNQLRDYQAWHRHYDDPDSALSWRLGRVQEHLRRELDRHHGPVRILSVCSGDGRDVLGVLAERSDADRAEVVLIELHREIVGRARAAATDADLDGVEIRCADAGETDSYAEAVPADVVLLVGVLGNIARSDVDRLLDTTPQFCRPDGLLIWSRGVDGDADRRLNEEIRQRFGAIGFDEQDYAEHDGAALGAVRYQGPPVDLVPGQQLFTFLR